MRRHPTIARICASLVIAAAAAALAGASLHPARLLCIEASPRPVEVIVVLGGEDRQRGRCAAELFNAGVAPRIIMSGRESVAEIGEALLEGGVPRAVIGAEPAATSTKENAEFTVQLLRQQGIRRATLVTSWYHTRRALTAFQHFAPEIEFSAVPSWNERGAEREAEADDMRQVGREYLAIAWYFVRHGISPLATSG